ncbi:MAG TPA: aromatic ring-hydroxylating dioxygenase subunit alpha [Chloroflexota bacterium]|nr:aromatic ring-hydroxylating dioxygenase subunit alpha [Chloroflexota bacterium]
MTFADADGPVRTLPGRYYHDPAIYTLEQERIFSSMWVCIGRAATLPNSGDYLLADAGGESVLVLRDRTDRMVAYLNVCRHRGARLCTCTRGQLHATVQCRYHAWTYSLDGRLVGAPNMCEDPSFDRERHGLVPVAIALWEGLIWVHLAADPPALADQLGLLATRFAHYQIGTLRVGATIDYDVRANWKLIVENFSECYHCALIHPELSALVPSFKAGIVTGHEGGAAAFGPHVESLTLSGKTDRPLLPGLLPEDRHSYYGDVLLPNVFLNLQPDYVVIHRLQPCGPDRTRIVCEWLFAAEVAGQPDFTLADAVEFWDRVNRQDWAVCELAQQGVSSRAFREGGIYAPPERHIRRFNEWVLQQLGHEPPGMPDTPRAACAAPA